MQKSSLLPGPPPEAKYPFRGPLFARYRWLPYVLPLAAYLLALYLVPGPQPPADPELAAGPETNSWLTYPQAYCLQCSVTLAAVLFAWPAYRQVPLRLSAWAAPVGIAGAAIWIGLCKLALERRLLELFGWEALLDWGSRPAFDPFSALGDSIPLLYAFLVVRFFGLAALVPLIEEFFLRGFLMRFVVQANWWELPLGKVTSWSAALATVYGVAAHPGEPLAAAVWFSLVTVLYARTRKIWDCVVAHAVTNGLLGLYVLIWQDWALW
jgi:CAAX prenyl protease-like protein